MNGEIEIPADQPEVILDGEIVDPKPGVSVERLEIAHRAGTQTIVAIHLSLTREGVGAAEIGAAVVATLRDMGTFL
ncbi:hypothetical protein A3N99_02725 [Mycobacteroides abscessus]|uniref:hypothetical protein n=1 Tax=Mycobacteroides abscessus TaxID=36809 RepID=UPI00078BC83C|nr:hypothetical protein [Mycobacteroides abscessus]AMU39225.1 hypothetical protein A3N99_02725 [Mycobacteroides abscessus]